MKAKSLFLIGLLFTISIMIVFVLKADINKAESQIDLGVSRDKQDDSGLNNKGLVINEIIPYNSSLYPDEFGNYYDVIEIFNGTQETINLEGYGLSDDPMLVHKWVFPKVSIAAGQYLIVYASGLESDLESSLINNQLYANFKLNSEGEKLLFSDELGNVLSKLSFEKTNPNMSYGIYESEYIYFVEGSPGIANKGIAIKDIKSYMEYLEIKSNYLSGIYDEPLTLMFENNSEYELRFTMDGSDPKSNSKMYEEGIYIDYTDKLPVRISNIPSNIILCLMFLRVILVKVFL